MPGELQAVGEARGQTPFADRVLAPEPRNAGRGIHRGSLPKSGVGKRQPAIDHPHPLAASIFLRQSARGDAALDSHLLLALAPTFSLHEGTPTAPAGVWEITLR